MESGSSSLSLSVCPSPLRLPTVSRRADPPRLRAQRTRLAQLPFSLKAKARPCAGQPTGAAACFSNDRPSVDCCVVLKGRRRPRDEIRDAHQTRHFCLSVRQRMRIEKKLMRKMARTYINAPPVNDASTKARNGAAATSVETCMSSRKEGRKSKGTASDGSGTKEKREKATADGKAKLRTANASLRGGKSIEWTGRSKENI